MRLHQLLEGRRAFRIGDVIVDFFSETLYEITKVEKNIVIGKKIWPNQGGEKWFPKDETETVEDAYKRLVGPRSLKDKSKVLKELITIDRNVPFALELLRRIYPMHFAWFLSNLKKARPDLNLI